MILNFQWSNHVKQCISTQISDFIFCLKNGWLWPPVILVRKLQDYNRETNEIIKVGSCIGWLLLAFAFEGLKTSRSYFLSQCQPGYTGNSPIWRLLERPYCLASAIYVLQVRRKAIRKKSRPTMTLVMDKYRLWHISGHPWLFHHVGSYEL